MPRAFLPLMAVPGHYGLQNPEPADNSWRECVQQLSPDRRVYGEIERRVQLRANMRLVLQTASPRCQHSPLAFFRSFGRTAYGYGRRRPAERRVLERLARAGLQA